MRRITIAWLWGMLAAPTILSQETKKPPFSLPTPKGWRSETIQLPPPFAPKMKWKGTEELRFAPGTFKPDSDSFFSYTFLFWLPGEQKIDRATLQQEMLLYYRGLCKAVLESKEKVDVSTFKLKLAEVKTDGKPHARDGSVVTEYVGDLTWVEPFVTKKQQTLHLEIHSWRCKAAKSHCIFVCASPMKPEAGIWKELRQLRTAFRCQE